jgi:hypothetical protein
MLLVNDCAIGQPGAILAVFEQPGKAGIPKIPEMFENQPFTPDLAGNSKAF